MTVPPVVVLVPGRDCPDLLDRCLRSIDEQDHPDVSVVVLDDASADTHWTKALRWTTGRPTWQLYTSPERQGATRLLWEQFPHLPAGTVAVVVDADDYLPHPTDLSTIAAAYNDDPHLLMTWGSYVSEPHDPACHPAQPYPPHIVDTGRFRHYARVINHPVSFRAELAQAVPRHVACSDGGRWVSELYDEALFIPMVELAGPHHRCLPDTLYVYNTANPASVVRSAEREAQLDQQFMASVDPLPRLFRDPDTGTLGAAPRSWGVSCVKLCERHTREWVVDLSGALNVETLADSHAVSRVVSLADSDTYEARVRDLLSVSKAVVVDRDRVSFPGGWGLPPAVWWLPPGDQDSSNLAGRVAAAQASAVIVVPHFARTGLTRGELADTLAGASGGAWTVTVEWDLAVCVP